jgi:hypothetical protein
MLQKGKNSGSGCGDRFLSVRHSEDAVPTVQDSPANQRLSTVEAGSGPMSVAGTGTRAGPHKNNLVLGSSR